jgi:hypothetical protein
MGLAVDVHVVAPGGCGEGRAALWDFIVAAERMNGISIFLDDVK